VGKLASRQKANRAKGKGQMGRKRNGKGQMEGQRNEFSGEKNEEQ
jgi:hypothetical protein